MGKRMDSKIIKKANLEFSIHFPTTLPSMGWYFSNEIPRGSIELPEDKWTCMFERINQVAAGDPICFSKQSAGCRGAACYFGFTQPNKGAGEFLASKEKFKECPDYGNAFYRQIKAKKPKIKYLVLSNLDQINDDICIEVVNCWVNPLSLSGLVTLSNFDSPENNTVKIPCASGCQSMWTLPYKEKDQEHPRATVGALDPAMRKHVAADTMLFSVPANRFNIMTRNISKSFAGEKNWLNLIK